MWKAIVVLTAHEHVVGSDELVKNVHLHLHVYVDGWVVASLLLADEAQNLVNEHASFLLNHVCLSLATEALFYTCELFEQ